MPPSATTGKPAHSSQPRLDRRTRSPGPSRRLRRRGVGRASMCSCWTPSSRFRAEGAASEARAASSRRCRRGELRVAPRELGWRTRPVLSRQLRVPPYLRGTPPVVLSRTRRRQHETATRGAVPSVSANEEAPLPARAAVIGTRVSSSAGCSGEVGGDDVGGCGPVRHGRGRSGGSDGDRRAVRSPAHRAGCNRHRARP